MSIYDDLANSDFVDKGRFKAQLREMGHDPDQEHDYQDEFEQAEDVEAEQGISQIRPQQTENPMDQINEQTIKQRMESRSHMRTEGQIGQYDNAEMGHAQAMTFDEQIKQAHLQRNKFEQQTKTRESLLNENLLDEHEALRNQSQTQIHQPFGGVDRRRFILDNDSEENEETIQSQTANGGGTKSAQFAKDSKQQSSQFTLNKYESKQEIQNDGTTMDTAHFKKQRLPGGEVITPSMTQKVQFNGKDDQSRKLVSQGTGQFGSKENNRNDYHQERGRVDQFTLDGMQASPRIRNRNQEKNEQVNQLLAQLQGPLDMGSSEQDPLSRIPSNFEIDRVHQQMQESIKQLNLGQPPSVIRPNDSGSQPSGMGFNGQNSLYELAQKVGQPLSSSNFNSTSNEQEMNKYFQGDGSMGSNPYYHYGLNSQYTNHDEATQKLLMQMQDSDLSHKYAALQNDHQRGFNEKENFNAKNIAGQTDNNYGGNRNQIFNQNQMIVLNSNTNYNQPVQSYGQPKRQLSLAERANLAKQQKDQQPTYPQVKVMPNQGGYQNYNLQHGRTSDVSSRPSDAYYLQQYNQSQNPSFVNNGQQFDLQNRVQPTRPQLPYQGQNQDFSKTNQYDKIAKRQALMAQFDDIPIHQLHKADGYQIRNIDDSEVKDTVEVGDDEEELKGLSLKDQCFHAKWKVRQNAYSQINQEFKNFNHPDEISKEDIMYGGIDNPFDMYGPLIEQMIQDSNLTAQVEGLSCLQTFLSKAKDIKSVSFSCHSFLLDKIQHNKPNLKEITLNILQVMLQRKQPIVPEIIKRFSSKNKGVIQFCLCVMLKAIEDENIGVADINLKMVFRQANELLLNPNKEIRDGAFHLMVYTFRNCEDDLNTFTNNLKSLRPVQMKEIKEQLAAIEKNFNSEYLVRLFEKAAQDQAKVSPNKKSSPRNRSKSQDSLRVKEANEGAHDSDGGDERQQVDLHNLLPDNFTEIPYVNQIGVKRKSLEQFNQELEKLVKRQDQEGTNVVKVKDYQSILNIVIHMLEDPNMLVFIEAIKMVEYLCQLLKQQMKSKMKQLIQLLADKYKETKTQVLQALEKIFEVILENKCVQTTTFYEQMVNQIAATHKNPRVKQMVIDRVELLIEKFYMTDDGQMRNQDKLSLVFKQIKDKLKTIIQKDTNAQVRDSGISLLTTFRIILNGTESEKPVQDLVNSLPKARIQEISFRVEHYFQQNGNGGVTQRENDQFQSQISQPKTRAHSGNKSGAVSKRNKSSEKFGKDHNVESTDQISLENLAAIANKEQTLLFQTKKAQAKVSSNFQMSLSEVILTIKNLGSNHDRLRPEQIEANFLQSLDELQEDGVAECKPAIVKCIHWLLTVQSVEVDFIYDQDRQFSLLSILMLMKKLYVTKRQFGGVDELFDAVRSVVRLYGLCDNQNAVNQVLSVIQVAALNCKLVSTLGFVKVVKEAMIAKGPETGQKMREQVSREIGGTIQYIADKVSDLMLLSQMSESLNESLQMADIEDLRAAAVAELEKMGDDEENKDIIIESLVYLKNKMQEYVQKQQINMQGDTESQVRESQESQFGNGLPEVQNYDQRLPRHEQVMTLIDENFEQGLLLMKELVKDEQQGIVQVTFEQKHKLVQKLIRFTTLGYKNPQEQYKQAYSLKALMWLKEEFIGLEECFKLTHLAMEAFADAMLDERDSSIEQYLLNFWTKDLSLRDINDRINHTVLIMPYRQQEVFNVLFSWVVSQKLQTDADKQTSWSLEDFRKVASMVAQNILRSVDLDIDHVEMSTKFIEIASHRFGAKKVRDFMEIQLIQDNDLLIRFLDLFDGQYADQLTTNEVVIKKTDANDHQNSILQEPLLTERTGAQPSTREYVGKDSDRSSMFKDLRNQRKQEKQDCGQDEPDETVDEEKRKYEEILQRIDRIKAKTHDEDGEISVAIKGVNELARINTSTRVEKEVIRPVSRRYQTQEEGQKFKSQKNLQKEDSLGEFNDEEDFKLSNDPGSIKNFINQTSRATLQNIGGSVQPSNKESQELFMQDRINMQQHRPGNTAAKGQGDQVIRVNSNLGEGLRELNTNSRIGQNSVDFSNDELQESRQKIRESVQYQEEKLMRLQSSQIKARQFKNDVDVLEDERKKLDLERRMLMQEANHESEQWKLRYKEMTAKNDEIIQNLASANQSYLLQVGENEKLSKAIENLQRQHREMIEKYKVIEQKLFDSEKQVMEQKVQIEESLQRTQHHMSPNKHLVVEEESLSKIEEAFDHKQMMKYGANQSDGEVGVRKIQELLLDSEGNSKFMAKSLIVHYQKMKSKVDRMQMINALKGALDHEDVLYAISYDVYKSLLNFLLNAFSFEKELIERESIATQHERESQNELTQESQKLVSKLLNSKEFTASLVVLLQLLKNEAMPNDFRVHLSVQERQYMRVIMRCISRITKALHSENPDLIRAFDVLHEMHKMFLRHPPENLRQDLPCLSDFDFVYRGLKEVSDKLIELQPHKCKSFLDFASSDSGSTSDSERSERPSAFTKYLKQMLQ